MKLMHLRREPVSVVCVWNNERVRNDCLERSIRTLFPSAPRTEFIPVDNRGQQHATAASALNAGARLATHDYVAFVQQDVYLHSLVALENAAGILADDSRWGMIGAVGISANGQMLGRIRDRIVLIGDKCLSPAPVDSLDEVLFVVRRTTVENEPLSESNDLAWHAYAVEYGLRLRKFGQMTGVIDIAITHNSLSTNIAYLDEAHAAVARMHPGQVPTQTTCGTVSASPRQPREQRFLAGHRWRLRWLRSSFAARRAMKVTGSRNILFSDIRRDIGYLLGADHPLRVHNITSPSEPFPDGTDGTQLRRGEHLVHFTSGPFEHLGALDPGSSLLVTNVTLRDLAGMRLLLSATSHVIGYEPALGYWVALGPAVTGLEPMRTRAHAIPFRPLVFR